MATVQLDPAQWPVGPQVRHARAAAAAGFFTQGLVFISLTTRLPTLQHRLGLNETTLSLLLLMMVLLAGVGSMLAEMLAKKLSSAVLLRVGLVLVAGSVPGIVTANSVPLAALGLGAYGIALGVVDAGTNMQAVAVEHLAERPLLPSFHSAWTLGGIVGSGVTLLTAHLPLGWVALIALVPLAATLAPYLPRVGDPVGAGPKVSVPWRPILLVGLCMVVFYTADTAVATWGPTFLERAVNAPSTLVALASFPYLIASFLMRLFGDPVVARFGPVPPLRAGAIAGIGSLAVIVFAPTWHVAVVGFTMLGASIAIVAPLSFSAAAKIAGAGLDPALRQARVDAVIGRFNQFNYLGSLVGAVMTGLVGSGNLRFGFALPMVLLVILIPLARAFNPRVAA